MTCSEPQHENSENKEKSPLNAGVSVFQTKLNQYFDFGGASVPNMSNGEEIGS